MDPIRRGAIAKMGRMLLGVGGGAAVAGMGRSQQTAGFGVGAFGQGDYEAQDSKWPNDSQINTWGDASLTKPARDPIREARYTASMPIREMLNDVRQQSERLTLSRLRGYGEMQHDLSALKSVAPWWKDSVALDRAKKLQSVVKTLEAEIAKIMTDPLESLQDTARQAIGAFLAEIQKS